MTLAAKRDAGNGERDDGRDEQGGFQHRNDHGWCHVLSMLEVCGGLPIESGFTCLRAFLVLNGEGRNAGKS
jgi:hypothetical protein